MLHSSVLHRTIGRGYFKGLLVSLLNSSVCINDELVKFTTRACEMIYSYPDFYKDWDDIEVGWGRMLDRMEFTHRPCKCAPCII